MFHSFSVEKNDFTRPNSLQELVAEYTEIPEKMAAVARAEVMGFPSHHPLVGGLEHGFYDFPYIGNNNPI